VLVALLPHANSFGAFFVGDDFDFLVRMERMEGVGDAWGMTYWGEWEPLWYLGFYRDWLWWGLEPAGYHAASLFWLVLGVVVLFRLVAASWPGATLAPWAAALLFAAHPLHDEAVTYLAARGHPMSAALSLLALWSYVRMRRERSRRGRKLAWLGAALAAALLAALAKETALLLPVWVVLLEWCVLGGLRSSRAAVGSALRGGLAFLIPAVCYLVLRYGAVGLKSGKLQGPDDGVGDLLESCLRFIPEYALIGGLPLPFAFVGHDVVYGLRPLGWLIVAALVLSAGLAVARGLRREGRVTPAVGLYVTGLMLTVTSLLPVFWAGLEVKRRYFFTPSAGAAIAAAVVLQVLAARRSRAIWGLVIALTLAGSAGLVQRNQLYRGAGRVTLDFLETARRAPLDRPSPRARGEKRTVALLTLPRYAGGDGLSGAYVLHGTDARSVLRLAGVQPVGFSTGHKCHHADDYTAEVAILGAESLDLRVSFRTRHAYEAARRREPRDDREGRSVRMVLASSDDEARTLEYRVILPPGFLRDPKNELYLYSDGRFRRLGAPD
jgi:hypothetical protein